MRHPVYWEYHDSLPSTNTFALQELARFSDRSVVAARTQTSGRGRFDHDWVSEETGDLTLSLILKPGKLSSAIGQLPLYAAYCLAQILEELGVTPQIKWPNDILVGDKKLAGILMESKVRGGRIDGIVLGLGLNIATSSQRLAQLQNEATSLSQLLEQPITAEAFSRIFVDRFFERYDEYLQEGFPLIRDVYSTRLAWVGQDISYFFKDEPGTGRLTDIDEQGCLVVFCGEYLTALQAERVRELRVGK